MLDELCSVLPMHTTIKTLNYNAKVNWVLSQSIISKFWSFIKGEDFYSLDNCSNLCEILICGEKWLISTFYKKKKLSWTKLTDTYQAMLREEYLLQKKKAIN